jgi:hypothetical protein
MLSALLLAASAYASQEPTKISIKKRQWDLKEWEDGTRPYPRNLEKREEWYRGKNGENWYGPKVAQRIYSPGNWKLETYHSVPKDMAKRIEGRHPWGNRPNVMPFVWAPDGREITDVYIVTDSSFYHYDTASKRSRFIGSPEQYGELDGTMEDARLILNKSDASLDETTGRLYFSQKVGNTNVLRFVEKLLPYRCSKTDDILYLPAVLDTKELYQKIKSPSGGKLEPLFENGQRSEPVFVVRTNKSVKVRHLPGAIRGKRLLITPDGKGIYYARGRGSGQGWWLGTLYDITSLFDINSGRMLRKLKIAGTIPENTKSGDAPGTHGGNNLGLDGIIYTSQHGGSGGGPGRMFSINPESGSVTILYDSMPEDRPWRKKLTAAFDGPADAKSLWFTSTLWQTQCPRTGAIINGGWDNAGVRRYLDGFVTTIVGHFHGGFHQEPRPGWGLDFKNVHKSSNPAVAPDGDLYIADVNDEWKGKRLYTGARIVRIFRTDWPKEQPVNGYGGQFLTEERRELLMLEYAKDYIDNFNRNNKLLKAKKY